METGKQNAEAEGVNVVETFICNLEPDDDALRLFRGLAKAFCCLSCITIFNVAVNLREKHHFLNNLENDG